MSPASPETHLARRIAETWEEQRHIREVVAARSAARVAHGRRHRLSPWPRGRCRVQNEMDRLAERRLLVEQRQQFAKLARAVLEPDHAAHLAIVDARVPGPTTSGRHQP